MYSSHFLFHTFQNNKPQLWNSCLIKRVQNKNGVQQNIKLQFATYILVYNTIKWLCLWLFSAIFHGEEALCCRGEIKWVHCFSVAWEYCREALEYRVAYTLQEKLEKKKCSGAETLFRCAVVNILCLTSAIFYLFIFFYQILCLTIFDFIRHLIFNGQKPVFTV